MLKFHGIRFKNGVPERFETSYDLHSSLKEAVQIIAAADWDKQKSVEIIAEKINQLYLPENRKQNKKHLNAVVARLSRARDLVLFFFENNLLIDFNRSLYSVLLKPITISEQWEIIERLIVKESKLIICDNISELISNDSSFLSRVLQVVSLFFKAKTEECPPPHIQLKFIPKKFPQTSWISTKEVGTTTTPLWIPKNPLCRYAYLTSKVLLACKDEEIRILKNQQELELHQSSIANRTADEIFIEYPSEQLDFLEMNLVDSFILLQQEIQRNWKQEGIKIFISLIKHFQERNQKKLRLDLKAICDLVSKSKNKNRIKIVVFELMQFLDQKYVIRFWKNEDADVARKNHLIKILQEEKVLKNQEEAKWNVLLEVDDLFYSKEEQASIYFQSLKLIPDRIFSEDTRKRSYIVGLMSYFTGVMLLERKVVLEKSLEEIIESCAFTIPKSGKYRVIQKLKNELLYLKKENYIANFSIQRNPERNPMKDIFEIDLSNISLENVFQQQIESTPMLVAG